MQQKNHFTTRRGFIAASGFGGISLYGLWAAYGAAPSPLAFLGLEHPQDPTSSNGGGHSEHGAAAAPEAPTTGSGGHGGHGAATEGDSVEEFSRLTTEFAERYRMPDGSVYPRRMNEQSVTAMNQHVGHDMSAAMPADHAMPVGKDQPLDVLMTAGKWYYLPNVLRLDAGQAYRFRMMSVDIAHGASIQLGKAGRMMRLQPGRITEAALTFQKPGRYLMYCTVYCGEAHQLMQATIEVV